MAGHPSLRRFAKALPTLALLAATSLVACEPRAHDLTTLTVTDSLYHDPATGARWSGRVVQTFSHDSTKVEIQGQLLEGTWDGEFRVFHPNGRIRYEGSFEHGERCGPWTENADSISVGSVYEELVQAVESMGIYPPCG